MISLWVMTILKDDDEEFDDLNGDDMEIVHAEATPVKGVSVGSRNTSRPTKVTNLLTKPLQGQ